MPDEDEGLAEYSSPACFMHELDVDFRMPRQHGSAWSDVARWRKAERERLITARMAMNADERKIGSGKIAANATSAIGKIGSKIVSLYWPFRGEPDLRDWMIEIMDHGGRIALPVVVEKAKPLEFRLWAPGEPLERGVWNILVPSRRNVVSPDVVIAPVVGYDAENYRLGYGGGFFDRTLAAAPKKPFVVGVGYAASRIRTIYPQSHDIKMDVIVTDE
jgi:5,10-methenyltetrahydrofolate synthetase